MSNKENPMRRSRLTVTFLACMLTTYACCVLLPGVHADTLASALLAGALLGVFYLLLRPILRLLTIPIGCLTLGFTNFIIDIALLYVCSTWVPGFQLDAVWWAALAAVIINCVVMIAGGWR